MIIKTHEKVLKRGIKFHEKKNDDNREMDCI